MFKICTVIAFFIVLSIILLPSVAKTESVITGPYNISFDLSGVPDIETYNIEAAPRSDEELGPTESDRNDAWLRVMYKVSIENDSSIVPIWIMEYHDASSSIDWNATMDNVASNAAENFVYTGCAKNVDIVRENVYVDNHNATLYSFESSNGTLAKWIYYRLSDGNPLVDVFVAMPSAWADSMIRTLHVEIARENNTNNDLSKELLDILSQLHPDKDFPEYLMDMSGEKGDITYMLYFDGSMYRYPTTDNNGRLYDSPPKGVRPIDYYKISLNATPSTVLNMFIQSTMRMLYSEKRQQQEEQRASNMTKEQFINSLTNMFGRTMTYHPGNDTLIFTGETNVKGSDFVKALARTFKYKGPLPKMIDELDMVRTPQPPPW